MMSRLFALCFLSATLGGCALSHGRMDDEPDPPPPPCTPADCYRITDAGCLDLEDFYMPDTCTTYCVPGYAQLESGRAFCDGPSPSCSIAPSEFGFSDSPTEGTATVAGVDIPGGRIALALPDGRELVFVASTAAAASFFRGEVVGISILDVGGTTLQTIRGVTNTVTAVRSWSALPPGGLEVGGLVFRIGGLSCRAPAFPAECGMDSSYRLDASNAMDVEVGLEPGESFGFPIAFPDGSSITVTHGSAIEFGAAGCEVFVPWDIEFLVTQDQTVVDG